MAVTSTQSSAKWTLDVVHEVEHWFRLQGFSWFGTSMDDVAPWSSADFSKGADHSAAVKVEFFYSWNPTKLKQQFCQIERWSFCSYLHSHRSKVSSEGIQLELFFWNTSKPLSSYKLVFLVFCFFYYIYLCCSNGEAEQRSWFCLIYCSGNFVSTCTNHWTRTAKIAGFSLRSSEHIAKRFRMHWLARVDRSGTQRPNC